MNSKVCIACGQERYIKFFDKCVRCNTDICDACYPRRYEHPNCFLKDPSPEYIEHLKKRIEYLDDQAKQRAISERGKMFQYLVHSIKSSKIDLRITRDKLMALGPEPYKPRSEKQTFGSKGKENADAWSVEQWEAEQATYKKWRVAYLKLKKREVQYSNILFRSEQRLEAELACTPAYDMAVQQMKYDSGLRYVS